MNCARPVCGGCPAMGSPTLIPAPSALVHRYMRDHVVDQVGGGLRHTPLAARGAEPATRAAEGRQLVVTAVATAQPQEAVRQDAAFGAAGRRASPGSGLARPPSYLGLAANAAPAAADTGQAQRHQGQGGRLRHKTGGRDLNIAGQCRGHAIAVGIDDSQAPRLHRRSCGSDRSCLRWSGQGT